MNIRIRKRLPLLIVAVLLATPFNGCATLGAAVGGKPMPKITVERTRLRSASARQVVVQVDFMVENPYNTPLPALGLDYRIWLTGVELTQGTAQVQRTIPARGRVPMSTTLTFGPLQAVKVAARLAFGKRQYRIQGVFRVRTPFGDMGVRFKHDGKLTGKSLFKRLIPGLGAAPAPPTPPRVTLPCRHPPRV
jgi:LEA14-like dessication related protein